jgi:hypothetical protein
MWLGANRVLSFVFVYCSLDHKHVLLIMCQKFCLSPDQALDKWANWSFIVLLPALYSLQQLNQKYNWSLIWWMVCWVALWYVAEDWSFAVWDRSVERVLYSQPVFYSYADSLPISVDVVRCNGDGVVIHDLCILTVTLCMLCWLWKSSIINAGIKAFTSNGLIDQYKQM